MKDMGGWIATARIAGGLALAGVVGAVIATLASSISRGGADAGDWLQFAGGTLGAGLAVLGAVYFDQRSRRLSKIESIAALESFIREWIAEIELFTQTKPATGAELKELMAHISLIVDRAEAVQSALNWMPGTDLRDLTTLRKIAWMKSSMAKWLPSMQRFAEVDIDRMNAGIDEYPLFDTLIEAMEPHRKIAIQVGDRLSELKTLA